MPASATSSPIKKIDGSRRISSAIASFTALERVISRNWVSLGDVHVGEDIAPHLRRVREGRGQRIADRDLRIGLHFDIYRGELLRRG